MGNVCEGSNQCMNPPARQSLRARSHSEGQHNLSLKKLIQFKKMKLTSQYRVDGLLGEGSYGAVYKVTHKQSQAVRAAKRISKDNRSVQSLEQFFILKRLDHPNIIRIYDIYSEDKHLYIVMDFCQGGELFDRVLRQGNLTENQARSYIRQILSGIQHCHLNKIMHRDLKPENIMFLDKQEKYLKIIDFGVSTTFSQNSITSLKVGSVYYIAPEVIKKKYDQKCDLWSIGVILYILFTGKPPFMASTDRQVHRLILKGQVPYPKQQWEHISTSARNLVERLLQVNPQKRITAQQALEHPWIRLQSQQGSKKLLDSNSFKTLKKFCQMNSFQAAVMAYISHNFSDTKTLEQLEKKFKTMDQNGDGRISWKQFHNCLAQILPNMTEERAREMFGTIDQNHSGFIDYSEFIASSMDRTRLKADNLVEKAFSMIDRDGNGSLSREELLAAFGGCPEDLQKYIMQQFDINRDGVISKPEFKLAMKGLIKK